MYLVGKKFAVKYFLVPLLKKVMYTVSSPVIFWNKDREAMRKMLKDLLVMEGVIGMQYNRIHRLVKLFLRALSRRNVVQLVTNLTAISSMFLTVCNFFQADV